MRTICRAIALALTAAALAACTSPSISPVLPYTAHAHALQPQDSGGGIPDAKATPPPG